jgi:hypothetical protein
MSLVITGTNLTIALFLLIAINGFLIIKKIPILAFSIVGISVIFLLVFPIDFNGLSLLLTLILVACIIGNGVSNYGEYKK